MFLAHVAPSFPEKAKVRGPRSRNLAAQLDFKALPDLLIGWDWCLYESHLAGALDHYEVMHSSMRTTLVQAIP